MRSTRIAGKTRIIVLSGPDGAGKTTLAILVKSILEKERELTILVHWMRGSHLLASILARILPRLSPWFRGADNPYYGLRIPPKARKLWILVEFASFLPYLFARKLMSLFYDLVLLDRGVYDFIVWLATTLHTRSFLRGLLGRFLLALALRERKILLYAPIQVLSLRADVPREFLVEETAIYLALSKHLDPLCAIDTSRSIREAVVSLLKCTGMVSDGSRIN